MYFKSINRKDGNNKNNSYFNKWHKLKTQNQKSETITIFGFAKQLLYNT